MSRSRSWCTSCMEKKEVVTTDLGYICCTTCGKVVSEDIYREEAQFVKDAAGVSRAGGTFVTGPSEHSASRQRTLHRAYEFMREMVENLGVGDGDFVAKPGQRLYEIALEKNFVRGRRAEQVAAACLYIACREKNKPFLLIEFSEYLRVNVYVLGAVFLQLCKVLHLQEHTIVQKLVDPSLYIHRFTTVLLGKKNTEIEKTAVRIMTSMKRDWMQTGRKPSGLFGAALYISALSYGRKLPKTDVIKAVHICKDTFDKRLFEFGETESGSLTIEEFIQKAEEIENNVTQHPFIKGSVFKEGELLCQHKSSDRPHFAHGLCEECYIEFIKLSGGLDGGSDPPAFQRAERDRLNKACADGNAKNSLLDVEQAESSCINPAIENVTSADAVGVDQMMTTKAAIEDEVLDSLGGISGTADDLGTEGDGDESDNFSDIDDAEVDAYLHNEEETQYKKVIWEKVNWEYLEEQAQKAAAGLLNAPKPKKERQKKTNGIAQTAAEAAHQMLSKKRVSSKLNHDRLKELFDEPVVSDSPKRIRTGSLPEKKNQGQNDDDNEDDDEKTAYDDYQDDPYDYNEEEYEEFDDGLF